MLEKKSKKVKRNTHDYTPEIHVGEKSGGQCFELYLKLCLDS